MAFRLQSFFELEAELTSPLDLTTPTAALRVARQFALAQGTGVGQADLMWSDQRTVAASATDTVDLAGSLSAPLGGTLTFLRIKMLAVFPAPGNTNNLLVQRPATNGVPLFSAVSANMPVPPGGAFLWYAPSAAGVAVTAGTGDLIDFVNAAAGTPVTYDVVIVGASA
ncbi:hypothetical protein [Nonomuraea sp. KM90]|uniref:hypothetical protein n=1 Tax=Nonomuraea sp. KM90 TaxID=3457428 RepID=UPI003FCD7488